MGIWLERKDILDKKEMFKNMIDPYTDYIESYSQKVEADRANSRYSKLVSFCNDLLVEFDNVANKLKEDGLDVTLEYCKGYFRIFYNGEYKYKKCNIVFKK